jgi:hypothetical protein
MTAVLREVARPSDSQEADRVTAAVGGGEAIGAAGSVGDWIRSF